MDNAYSYTSANGFPVKILRDKELINSITDNNFVLLRHLQLCPTNKCNQNCDYCSCQDRDKDLELSLDEIQQRLDIAHKFGCKGITITGGGEPLLYDSLQEVIDYCTKLKIKVGLVTNGIRLDKFPEGVSWCRISFDPNRKLPDKIEEIVLKHWEVDWSFSYVLYKYPHNIVEMVELANKLDFTHIRVVSDILNSDRSLMHQAMALLDGIDDKVIYQLRNQYTVGRKKCLISLLKPIIGADGKIYPCCGIQYARRNIPKDFNHDMGKDLEDILSHQKNFDGSECDICYYDNYNILLNGFMEDVRHQEWV